MTKTKTILWLLFTEFRKCIILAFSQWFWVAYKNEMETSICDCSADTELGDSSRNKVDQPTMILGIRVYLYNNFIIGLNAIYYTVSSAYISCCVSLINFLHAINNMQNIFNKIKKMVPN